MSGSLTSLDEIGAIVINPGAGAGRPAPPAAPINQLGTVQFVSLPADTITRTNGKPSIGLRILKAADGNTVTVANEVKAALPDLKTRIGNGIQFASIQDQATPISNAIAAILQEGLLGALFAIGIIFLFLRSGRATIVAAVSIPLSLLAALLVLWWQGITLNILTLGGMMVAIGRVVDDAIVVLENISRHVAEGENPMVAAYTGAREITTAVTSSTLATVAVFLPIVFLTGIAGSFFRPFALTVVTALIASLAVAVTVVPLLASRLLRPPSPDKVERRLDYNWMQRIYVPVIRWATSHRAITLVVASVMFMGSMALLPLVRVNLLDKSASPNFPIAITMPDNSTLSETSAETQKVENLIRGVPGISAFQATVGGISDPFAAPGTVPADPTQASVTVLVNQGAYDQALQGVTQALKGYSGPARVDLGQASSSSNSSSTQMQVDVHAPGQDTLAQANSQVLAALSHVSGLSQLKSNLAASKPQYKLVPTAKLGQSGLTLQQVALIVGQQVNGIVATQATLPQGRVNVRVQLPPGTADNAAALSATPIPTALGVVPLSTLATLQAGSRSPGGEPDGRRPHRFDHRDDHQRQHAEGAGGRHQGACRPVAPRRGVHVDRRRVRAALVAAHPVRDGHPGGHRARLPDHGRDLQVAAEAAGAPGLHPLRGQWRHRRAGGDGDIAVPPRHDRAADADRHRGDKRHRPARPRRAIPRPWSQP